MRTLLATLFWVKTLPLFVFFSLISQPLQAEGVTSLFITPRACKVGDTLTVIISEFSTASHTAKTGFKKGTETAGKIDLPSPAGGLPAWEWNYSTDYQGSGLTQRKGSLVARLTAQVVEVLPNGNLRIRGEKRVKINQEEQIIYVEGIVRPQDIGENNTISSINIAQASIKYEGRGPISEGRRPGLISRLLNWLGIF